MNTGSPSNPPTSGESDGKSGVRLTAEEHLERIEKGWGLACFGRHDSIERRNLCARCSGLESLTALREQIAELQAAAHELVIAMETCHICKGALLVDECPMHCEDGCSYDCEEHEEPSCVPLDLLHAALKRALRTEEPLVTPLTIAALALDAIQRQVDALAAEDVLLNEHGWIWRQGSNFWTHPDVVGYSCTREYALNRIRLQLELSAMRSRVLDGNDATGAQADTEQGLVGADHA